jgi:hypothetical protein
MVKNIIELQYLSPINSNNLSDNNLENILVLSNRTFNGFVMIREIRNIKLDNITNKTRGYCINYALIHDNELEFPILSIKLFQLNKLTNKLCVLFTGNIDLREEKKQHTIMHNIRANHTINGVDNKENYLLEFFDNSYSDTDKTCILITEKVYNTSKPMCKLFKLNINNSDYVYNRYSRIIFKEWNPIQIYLDNSPSNYFNKISNRKNQIGPYLNNINKLVNTYRIDLSISTKSNYNNMAELGRRYVISSLRPMATHDYDTNLFLSPIDGRVIGFNMYSKNSKIIHNKNLDILPYIEKCMSGVKTVIDGSGIIIRSSITDFHRINVPYSGNIVKLSPFKIKNKKVGTLLKIENDYYMANSVKERDQFSIAYGKCLSNGRGCHERLLPQEDTKLVYYMFLIGSTLKLNNLDDISNSWLEQGEDIGSFGVSESLIVIVCNRSIHFSGDINNNSNIGIETNNSPMETYVRENDLIGLLQ